MKMLLGLLLLMIGHADAQTLCEKEKLKSYNPIAGTIPLAFGHMPATDLVCDSDECGPGLKRGDILLPREARKYFRKRFEETRCQWILADLDPAQEKGIWQNIVGVKLNPKWDNLPLNDMDTVAHVSEGWARLGSYRITVNKNNKYGVPQQYTVMLSKNVHNFLLRKSLLRKLGYIIPPIKHVKRLRIQFDKNKTKKDFIKNLSVNNAGSFDRWVLSEKTKEVIVQDVIVMEDQEFRLNLAKGYLSPDIFQGKRIYDSLLIPYALTEVPESINMFDWTVGRIFSENVLVKFPYAKEYNTSRDDAVWMIRRLVKLTEKDWWEIVESTALPPSVKLLLFEKLKSRRNHLAHLFGVENINLPVNNTISNQDDLENGKLTKEFYDGYARRFKIPDPESPLSYSEMISFFKSKAITTGMELLLNAFNSASFMGTDISQKITDFNESLAANIAETVTTGESTKTPVKSFLFPTVHGNLILNREIVAGSYLGTDNLIQLVDTVGASVRVGVFGGVTGVYSKTGQVFPDGEGGSFRQFVPVDLTANSQLFLNRTYAHVKPITSVQKALKYPFKNMLVPMLKRKYGNYFDALMNTDYDKLADSEKKQVNTDSVDLLMRKTIEIKNAFLSQPQKVQVESVNKELDNLEVALSSIKDIYVDTLNSNKQDKIESLSKEVLAVYKSQKCPEPTEANETYTDCTKDLELTRTQVLELISNSLTDVKTKIANKYIIVEDCRVDVKEEINKYFSIVERQITDSDGNVTTTTEHICVASKKEKIHKDFAKIDAMLSTMTTEVAKHSARLADMERESDTEEVMNLLNENLEIGESIIVTDTIGGSLTTGVGVSLYNVVNVRMSAKANKMMVNRLHIHRMSEDEIHIYKALGNVNGIELAMSMQKFVPIMKITLKGTKGRGKTRFYKVKIGEFADDYNEVPNIEKIDKLKAIRNTLMTGSVKTLDNIQKPYTIVHKFKENSTKLGVFVWRWNWLNTSDNMTITSPEGYEKKMYRRNMGQTRGRDFENYAKDLVDLLVGKLFNQQFTISSFNEGNPGFTFMGKAKNKVTSYEGIYNEAGELERPYIKLSNIWNGWKLKKKNALKILRDIKKKYNFRFFEEDVLAQTKELFLYNINVNFFVYDGGIKTMLTLPEERVRKIWEHYQSRDMTNYYGDDVLARSGYFNFMALRKKYSRYLIENDLSRLSKTAIRMVKLVEENLRLAGIAQMFGGGNNMFVVGKIDGFRVGDENGDKKILSNSFGRVGTEDIDGPIARLKKFMGITYGEFYMSWLLGRVI